MLDIYSFFNSKDIGELCRSIGHKFTPAEMTAIIYKSNKSLEEKHEAYQKIIDDFPDMPMPIHIPTIEEQREWYRELNETPPLLPPVKLDTVYVPSRQTAESLHAYLKEWMEWEKQLQKDFLTTLPDTFDPYASKRTIYQIEENSCSIEKLFKTIHTWSTKKDSIVKVWKKQVYHPDPKDDSPYEVEMHAEYTMDGKMIQVFSYKKVGFTRPDDIPICLPISIQKSNSLEIVEEE